jgi:predicted glycosyl hydrolase (DUF1957 family)
VNKNERIVATHGIITILSSSIVHHLLGLITINALTAQILLLSQCNANISPWKDWGTIEYRKNIHNPV